MVWYITLSSLFFFSSRRRHTRCALVTGVQTCALPISAAPAKAPLLKYLVKFAPRDALYQRANEPLILIRELRELGGFLAKADASGVPPLDQIQAEGAYIKWDFEIEKDRGEAAIRAVFEFVQIGRAHV